MDRADILKVDFKRTTLEERGAMIKRYGPWRCRMLAEKVETHEEFHLARNQGFLYFQGYFFRKPEIMTAHEIPANRINYLRMLQAVSRAELDLREVENVLKSEASLCYRLLRYMNSAVFGFGSEIHSVGFINKNFQNYSFDAVFARLQNFQSPEILSVDPATKERLEQLGVVVVGSTPAELAAFLKVVLAHVCLVLLSDKRLFEEDPFGAMPKDC